MKTISSILISNPNPSSESFVINNEKYLGDWDNSFYLKDCNKYFLFNRIVYIF